MVTDTGKGILGELPVWMWFGPVRSLGKNRIPELSPPLVFQGVLEHGGNNYPICFLLDIKSMLKGFSIFRSGLIFGLRLIGRESYKPYFLTLPFL